ncbi:MAG: Trm112 family protein [Candidatus Omnitrophota bacterium]
MLDKKLFEILACPKCKKALKEENDELICLNCRKAYPIKDGIPIMLIEEARDLSY